MNHLLGKRQLLTITEIIRAFMLLVRLHDGHLAYGL